MQSWYLTGQGGPGGPRLVVPPGGGVTGSTAERRRISRLTCGVTRRFCFEVDFDLWSGGAL